MGLDLAKKVGPMPLGAWLLVGAGGLFIAWRNNGTSSDAGTVVPAGDALPTGGGYPATGGETGSYDGAPVVLSPIFRLPAPVVTITNKLPETPKDTTKPAPKPTPTPRVPPKKPSPKPKPAPVHKPAPKPKPTTRTHTVVKGDTLWSIAGRYYHNPLRWTTIYAANKATIEATAKRHGRASSSRGHWIYPGTVLVIP